MSASTRSPLAVRESRTRDWSIGRPKTALSAAAVVLLAVTATLTIITVM